MKIFISNLRFCAVAAYFCKRNSTLRCFASYVIPLSFLFHSKCTFPICYVATSTPTFAALLFLRSQFRVISFSIEIINRAIYEIIEFNCINMQNFITKTLLYSVECSSDFNFTWTAFHFELICIQNSSVFLFDCLCVGDSEPFFSLFISI